MLVGSMYSPKISAVERSFSSIGVPVNQLGHAVDLGTARATLACLAVPANREVATLSGLQTVDDVQDNVAVIGVDGVVRELSDVRVAAPDPKVHPVAHNVLAADRVAIRSPPRSTTASSPTAVSPSPSKKRDPWRRHSMLPSSTSTSDRAPAPWHPLRRARLRERLQRSF